MKTAEILSIISITAAAAGILLIIYLTAAKRYYRGQLRKMRHEENVAQQVKENHILPPHEAFDWKYDDFESRFVTRFILPTAITIALCIVSLITAILGRVLK